MKSRQPFYRQLMLLLCFGTLFTFAGIAYGQTCNGKYPTSAKELPPTSDRTYTGSPAKEEVLILQGNTNISFTLVDFDSNDSICINSAKKVTIEGAGELIATDVITLVGRDLGNVNISTDLDVEKTTIDVRLKGFATIRTGKSDDEIKMYFHCPTGEECKGSAAVSSGGGNDDVWLSSYQPLQYGDGNGGSWSQRPAAWIDTGSGDDKFSVADLSSFFVQLIVIGGTGKDDIKAKKGVSTLVFLSGIKSTSFDNLSSDYNPLKNFMKDPKFNAKDIKVYSLNTLATNAVVEPSKDTTANYAYCNYADEAIIFGADGDDQIYDRCDSTVIYGLDGNDEIYIEGKGEIWGGDGDDNLTGSPFYDSVIHGGNGNDVIYGTYEGASYHGKYKLYGDADDDVIYGRGGNDLIAGGTGNDKIYGEEGNDEIDGGENNDIIQGGDGDDIISGGDDRDEIYGDDSDASSSTGNDLIYGDDGDDIIHAGGGRDFVVGGADNDEIYGDDDNDELYGNEGSDYIKGGDGDDYIEGGDGENKLYGDSGNDSINGGKNRDRLWGGTGNDKMKGGAGADDIYGENDNDTMEGNDGNDLMKGGRGNDTVRGNAGDDDLFGNEDRDYLLGGDGKDSLLGGSGDDTLRGEDGVDTLDGESGTDDCYGGTGADVLTSCEK